MLMWSTLFAGTAGGSIGVLSNFFQLKQAPDFHMFQYHVDFSPDIENKNMRQRLVKEHRELLGKARAFDGMLLFMARKLEQPVSTTVSYWYSGRMYPKHGHSVF